MNAERRLRLFCDALLQTAWILEPHEFVAVVRFALRDVEPDVLERLAEGVAVVEALEGYEHAGKLGGSVQ